jgi:hypothetical protein
MEKKIFENVMVTIENDKTKKKIWLEEYTENNKVVGYKVQKDIEYKLPPVKENEIKQ